MKLPFFVQPAVFGVAREEKPAHSRVVPALVGCVCDVYGVGGEANPFRT